MRLSLTLLATLVASTIASPIHQRSINATTPFYLITTSTSASSSNSSTLPNATLTTLFDPSYQPNYLLRQIAPGYNSVPTFTLTDGILHTKEQGPHGVGTYVYNSTEVHTGSELQFRAEYEGTGDLGLVDGYLLGVNGSAVGWTVCVEELQESVVEWMGTDESCQPTYLQAVSSPPY